MERDSSHKYLLSLLSYLFRSFWRQFNRLTMRFKRKAERPEEPSRASSTCFSHPHQPRTISIYARGIIGNMIAEGYSS